MERIYRIDSSRSGMGYCCGWCTYVISMGLYMVGGWGLDSLLDRANVVDFLWYWSQSRNFGGTFSQ